MNDRDEEMWADIALERWHDRLQADPRTAPGYSPPQDPPEHWDAPSPAATPAPSPLPWGEP